MADREPRMRESGPALCHRGSREREQSERSLHREPEIGRVPPDGLWPLLDPVSQGVVRRFVLHLVLVSAFAFIVRDVNGFTDTLITFLLFSGLLCVWTASLRRETIHAPVLTHWDEALALMTLSSLIAWLG